MKNIIAEMLGKSPVHPIQRHIDTACESAALLVSLFVAANLNDWDKVSSINEEIRRLENKADSQKLEIRSNLPKSLFMPVPRQDLLELVLVQDKIANIAKSISGMIKQRKIQIPAQMYAEFIKFVELSIKAAKSAQTSVHELDELYETGFRGAEAKLVQDLIDRLDKIETENDEKQDFIQQELFKIEKELAPIDVMFLYKLIDKVGAIADMSERVGRRLEILLAK
ncbi:Phosphate transport regulator (distant homolog of PhoU) [hydrothermal vent metagenome]|uniref:Phosphate transport regulator (Distant homolog of PhoU) n=1 Tax=hydrothermal vent metagenome TaxID=652676 RepID=A0A3B0WSR4_9ZZZZ